MKSGFKQPEERQGFKAGEWGVMLVATLSMVLLRWLLTPLLGTGFPYVTIFAAVAFSSVKGGAVCGIVSMVLGYVAAYLLFLEPTDRFDHGFVSGLIPAVVYVFTSGIIIHVSEQLRLAMSEANSRATKLSENSRSLEDEIARRGVVEAELKQQQTQLQAFFDHSDAVMYIKDLNHRILFANARYRQLFKVEGEMIGKREEEFFPREIAERFMANDKKVVEARKALHFEEEAIQADGLHIYLSTKFPLMDSAGEVYAIGGISTDITQRKAAEAAVMETEVRLRTALDAGQLGVWEWDIRNNRVSWSDRLYEFHGLKFGEFGGTVEAFARIVHPEDASMVQKAIQRAIEEKAPYELVFRTVRPDGQVRWLRTAARVLFAEDGTPLRMLGGTVDITRQKKQEELLQSQADHLEALVAERTARLQETISELESFSYSISHDMRGPLRAMQGFASVLDDDFGPQLGPEGSDYTQRIRRAATRLDSLIQDVLSYSKVARSELKLSPVNLNELLSDITSQYPGFQPPGAILEIEGNLPLVLGQESLLTQCFSNLIGNGIKFCPPGQTPRIRIRAETREERIRIWVEDNGIGIAPEHQERIFQIFERVNESYEGTGIGLSIVRKAVERMGGEVGLVSELGKGSRFWIVLKPAPISTF
ncbi:MAG: PAS domain-containing protein [Verrucomicrobiota bacterium]|nr:PAS domain-containing protein [Verrucomicrobiota bacterium]